ncbi:hypothetical protein EIN_029760 [Entamoeba invadens IP1]|uniref:Fe-containing alcohol dehydrogenase-like C-terminal domain-containing protein n=1 Tax=Entamoeba invadens IP1 TaxID=370355 RepID=A0A0A1TY32_ENTIV|nr:hypothetical protein EIN_029760 [Entamoeba invadens IP1]ELP86395.1 hypothetical protein EIN_029760 [Entamoeba invadens IP1]|eukprot:XP_004185741.1 hypothetical protein EIN_029760 [Entamoeba invadens IP1]
MKIKQKNNWQEVSTCRLFIDSISCYHRLNVLCLINKRARAGCGIDVLVHVVVAYVPTVLLKVSQISLRRLGQVIQWGFVARENMHNAATIDGMAFSSTFLGIIHSMAHKTGTAFRLPYGRCVAVLLKSETTAEGVEVLAKAKTSTHIDYNKRLILIASAVLFTYFI